MLARPTSFHYEVGGLVCTAPACSQEVIALGNPVIWWAAVLAMFHQAWRWAAVRDWRARAVLCGFLAGWAPWLLFQERTVFAFLLDRFLPSMVTALTMSREAFWVARRPIRERRRNGKIVVVTFLFVALAASWWFYPIWTAEIIHAPGVAIADGKLPAWRF